MDLNHVYWKDGDSLQHMKYESCNSNDGQPRLKDEPIYKCCDSNLNFATVTGSEDDSEYGQYKKNKVSRQDPMSHRIIEKRRRDRMNNCLADLSRLIPVDYLKKGRGRIEKTEIIEMAIKHIKYLQQVHRVTGREEMERSYSHEQYRLGYQECMSETMRFLVEVEGYFAHEALCVKLINHLQKHCENLLLRDRVSSSTNVQMDKEYNQPSPMQPQISSNTNMAQIRLQSPMRQTAEQYDNSQLRDMLTSSILRDERNKTVDIGQHLRSPGRENVREPTPDHDKPDHTLMFKSGSEEYEYQKSQQEMNESNGHKPEHPSRTHASSDADYDKSREYTNGASLYKFKNNIKQRFSQDLHAETNTKEFKRQKMMESNRRNSVTTETYSSENHSSPMDGSQCSPPSSEMYRISSESEAARISPTGSSVSDVRKSGAKGAGFGRYSPNPKHSQCGSLKGHAPPAQPADSDKVNFSVPIFALHAKGSFYIPLTIDYHTLVPYLQHQNILDMLPNVHNIILHPVTINVNFQSNYFGSVAAKPAKHKAESQNGWH